jgi:hypothetical protein
MIGSTRPLDGLTEQVKLLNKAAEQFWYSQCFGSYIHKFDVTSHGSVNMKLTFSISHIGNYNSEHPVSERKTLEQRVESLKERGFDLLHTEGSQYEIADTDNNKGKVLRIIKAEYPSARIGNIKISCADPNKEEYYIREIEVYVWDIKDFKGQSHD